MYCIIQVTGQVTKYLANRSKVKDSWWVDGPELAMWWEYKAAAIAKKNTLRFGKNHVICGDTGEIVG